MMKLLTARALGWLSGGLAVALAATMILLGIVVRDRDAKAEDIGRLERAVTERDGVIRLLRRDVGSLQLTDAADVVLAAKVCADDVTTAFARGITMGRAVCAAQAPETVQ